MIIGHCFTNIDEYKRYNWPKVFAIAPKVGDVVAAHNDMELRVCRITHSVTKSICSRYDREYPAGTPYLKIELHRM